MKVIAWNLAEKGRKLSADTVCSLRSTRPSTSGKGDARCSSK
ncbi:MAG: hypothetical protein WKF75_10430 [Singulisphaera sp.]